MSPFLARLHVALAAPLRLLPAAARTNPGRLAVPDPRRVAWYHGTSRKVLAAVRAGGCVVMPTHVDANVSLGGAYFTTDAVTAGAYAEHAAWKHDSHPVVLVVRPRLPLMPDEDWVVRAFKELPMDRHDVILDDRYRDFFGDLFTTYDGNGSMSDAYRDRYDELNSTHGISWEDSWRFLQSARQEVCLDPHQIVRVIELPRALRPNPVDPKRVTKYDRSTEELEEFMLFAASVTGAESAQRAVALECFLAPRGDLSPFEWVMHVYRTEGTEGLVGRMQRCGLGQWNRLTDAFVGLASCGVDLRFCSLEALEYISGVKRKSSRFFTLHSRPGVRISALDTHILKKLREHGVDHPHTATPQDPEEYAWLEREFLRIADERGMTPAELDLQWWTEIVEEMEREEQARRAAKAAEEQARADLVRQRAELRAAKQRETEARRAARTEAKAAATPARRLTKATGQSTSRRRVAAA